MKRQTWVGAIGKQKDQKMARLGRKGGKRGGKTRAANLTKEQLSAIGRIGASARWGKP